MTTTVTVLDQICQFFGGSYDSTLKTYHTPTVSGLSLVRRSWAKQDDDADYFYGQTAGTATGALMVAQIVGTRDHRIAFPALQGRRKVHYMVELHVFILSMALYAEDCQDFMYTLRDAIVAKIRTDPTLGTGGIEAGNFQVGEGSEDGGGEIVTSMSQAETTAELTKSYLLVAFEAHAYDVA